MAAHKDHTQRQAILAAYASTNLTQHEFCRLHGISVPTLHNWRKASVVPRATGGGTPPGTHAPTVHPRRAGVSMLQDVRVGVADDGGLVLVHPHSTVALPPDAPVGHCVTILRSMGRPSD